PVPLTRSVRLGVNRSGIVAVAWSVHVSSVRTSWRPGGSNVHSLLLTARSTVHRSTMQAASLCSAASAPHPELAYDARATRYPIRVRLHRPRQMTAWRGRDVLRHLTPGVYGRSASGHPHTLTPSRPRARPGP